MYGYPPIFYFGQDPNGHKKRLEDQQKERLQDQEDLKEAEKVLADMGKTYSLEEVEAICDLDYPDEMQDHLEVLRHSAKIGKYAPNNWLNADGKGCDHKSQYASIFRHVAEAYMNVKVDKDSGLDPRLHAAVRLMMDYTRDKQGIVHPLDESK